MKKYVESKNKKIRIKIIERIVDITNELYSNIYNGQTYYGLKEIKNLIEQK